MSSKKREQKRRLREKRVKKKLEARRQRLRAERREKELEEARALEIARQASALNALIPPETIEISSASSDCPTREQSI